MTSVLVLLVLLNLYLVGSLVRHRRRLYEQVYPHSDGPCHFGHVWDDWTSVPVFGQDKQHVWGWSAPIAHWRKCSRCGEETASISPGGDLLAVLKGAREPA